MLVTRHGFKELLVGTVVLVLMAAALGWGIAWWAALVVLPVLVWLFAFFRDPERQPPAAGIAGGRFAFVSPADGRVSDVTELDSDPVLGEPAVRVGIFLSVFNVHINRSPCDGVVSGVTYKKGKFLNAMGNDAASEHNESNTVVIADREGGEAVAVVKQIVGLIARRIVCSKKPGDPVTRGERIGMIKFGSRTELTVPRRLSPKVLVQVGQKVRAGSDVMVEAGVGGDVVVDTESEPLATSTPN